MEPADAIVFVALVVGLSFIFTWIFNGSGGSLIPPVLFHATQNWEEGFEAVYPAIVGTDWEKIAAIGIVLLSIVAVVAVARSGRDRSESETGTKPLSPASKERRDMLVDRSLRS